MHVFSRVMHLQLVPSVGKYEHIAQITDVQRTKNWQEKKQTIEFDLEMLQIFEKLEKIGNIHV